MFLEQMLLLNGSSSNPSLDKDESVLSEEEFDEDVDDDGQDAREDDGDDGGGDFDDVQDFIGALDV